MRRSRARPARGARVPRRRAEREVAQIRYRIADAEAARDRGDYAKAVHRDDAPSAKLWPPLHAEVLYTIAVDESLGGDHELALKQLREAAAYAEAQHHDYIAANAWLQLCQGTTADQGDPQRGLEYVTYASAAIDRLGRPPSLVAILEYVKGTALVDLGRYAEAETALRHTVELARLAAPEYLPQALQGLGYLYEDEGRLTDAIAAYRDALAHLPAATGITAVIFRERLAINLSHTGHADEAETPAREAVAIADKSLGERSSDRADAWRGARAGARGRRQARRRARRVAGGGRRSRPHRRRAQRALRRDARAARHAARGSRPVRPGRARAREGVRHHRVHRRRRIGAPGIVLDAGGHRARRPAPGSRSARASSTGSCPRSSRFYGDDHS